MKQLMCIILVCEGEIGRQYPIPLVREINEIWFCNIYVYMRLQCVNVCANGPINGGVYYQK